MAKMNAISEIEKLGGSVEVDAKNPDRPVLKVRLDGPHVTDADLRHLKGMTDLRTLDLFDTHITDAGLETLKEFTSITWLDVESPHVTDKGLQHLQSLSNLHTLLLACSRVTKAGIKQLEAALPQVRIGAGK